jgi:hypothetical protein
MITKQLSLAMILSICVGLAMAWSNLNAAAVAPAAKSKIDFDQVFADATRQGEFNAAGRVAGLMTTTRTGPRWSISSIEVGATVLREAVHLG